MATATDTRSVPPPTRAAPTQARKINRAYLAAGLLFLALSGLMGGLLLGRVGETNTVWVATGELPARHTISRGDLQPLVIPADINLEGIPAAQDLQGRVLRLPVPAGGMLEAATLYDVGDTFETDGRSEVGLRLTAGRAPMGLRVGDEVIVVAIPAINKESIFAGEIPATVVRVELDSADNFNSTLVVLAVESSDAAVVAQGAALERVVLVISRRG